MHKQKYVLFLCKCKNIIIVANMAMSTNELKENAIAQAAPLVFEKTMRGDRNVSFYLLHK